MAKSQLSRLRDSLLQRMNIKQNPKKFPRFLALPPELRNIIYTLALTYKESTRIFILHHYERDRKGRPLQGTSTSLHIVFPPLLHASRQVRTDALGLFFAMDTFRLVITPPLVCGVTRSHYSLVNLQNLSTT